MLTPAPQLPDERGNRWLEAQVQQMLAAAGIALAAQVEDRPACYWGTTPATETTLYVRLAGDPVPKALPFRHTTILQCGSGLYPTQHHALLLMRRTLRRLGVLSP